MLEGPIEANSGISITPIYSARGVTIESVTFAGSGIVFNNTYTANVSQAYKSCVLAAEQDIASRWNSSVTIYEKFDAVAGGINGQLASNSFYVIHASYPQLKNALTALASTENNPYLQEAVAHLPSSDPTGGEGFELARPYARLLGLTSAVGGGADDVVTLNISYSWDYGQDVINTLEHEITEGGMGRIGGLGDQNNFWSVMDLFRYNSSGQPDYTDGRDGRTTYFSYDGGATLSLSAGLSFNNQYNSLGIKINSGDVADFNETDVFGAGAPGETHTLSQTDIEIMNVLGWNPASQVLPTAWNIAGTGDFNGNHVSDVLWRNTDGSVGIWLMNGAQIATSQTIASSADASPDWHIEGTGDFNNDGNSDILWRADDGSLALWFMNGTQILSTPLVATSAGASADWHIAGTGDFNNDGNSDILWRADDGSVALWLMNGAQILSSPVIATSADSSPDWHIAGAGDFNNDGNSDILWRADDGSLALWFMNGTQILSTPLVATSAGASADWHIAGTGDFSNDGNSDILWRNDDGSVALWLMNGAQILSSPVIATSADSSPDWHIAGTGDFNNDGNSDILWHADDGSVAIWSMNGTQVASTGIVDTTNNTLQSAAQMLISEGSSDPTASNLVSENQTNANVQNAYGSDAATAAISGGPTAANPFTDRSSDLVASGTVDPPATPFGGDQVHTLDSLGQSNGGPPFVSQQPLPADAAGHALLVQYMASSIVTTGDGGTPITNTPAISMSDYPFLTQPHPA